MAHYVDGFVLPVPEDKLEAYLEMPREAGEIRASTASVRSSRARPWSPALSTTRSWHSPPQTTRRIWPPRDTRARATYEMVGVRVLVAA